MKRGLACGTVLLAVLTFAGCTTAPPPPRASSGGARCLGRPDSSGTQPLIYILCIQTN